ncbi:MAG: hypothetical protein R3F59_35120 [Myxococcota bacterium]
MRFPRLVLCNAPGEAFLARPLVGEGGDAEIPWVGVASGHAAGRFVLAERSEPAVDRSLVAEAGEHLRGLPWSWSVAEQSGFLWFKKPSLLRAYGDLGVSATEMATDGGGVDDLSTEVLLVPKALREAAEQLRAGTLAVIVPKRGWLLAKAAEPGDLGATSALFQMETGIAQRGGQHALCATTVVFVRDGVPVGVEVRAGGGYVSLSPPSEAAWFMARE